MRSLAAAAALLDLLLSLVTFALLARPELFLGLIAQAVGVGEAWRTGRLDEEGRTRLLRVAERAGVPALALLFGFSFIAGALLLLSRL